MLYITICHVTVDAPLNREILTGIIPGCLWSRTAIHHTIQRPSRYTFDVDHYFCISEKHSYKFYATCVCISNYPKPYFERIWLSLAYALRCTRTCRLGYAEIAQILLQSHWALFQALFYALFMPSNASRYFKSTLEQYPTFNQSSSDLLLRLGQRKGPPQRPSLAS